MNDSRRHLPARHQMGDMLELGSGLRSVLLRLVEAFHRVAMRFGPLLDTSFQFIVRGP